MKTYWTGEGKYQKEEQEHKAHIVKETRLASYREVIANLGERQQTIVQKFKESGKYYTASNMQLIGL